MKNNIKFEDLLKIYSTLDRFEYKIELLIEVLNKKQPTRIKENGKDSSSLSQSRL